MPRENKSQNAVLSYEMLSTIALPRLMFINDVSDIIIIKIATRE